MYFWSAMNHAVTLSIVSPVYKAEQMLDELVLRLEQVLSSMHVSFEIILVDDGSPDKSWRKIETICSQKTFVKGISLSRNFGQHHAITAGIDYANGEWIIVIDCDLQDRPEEIYNLYQKALEGYDIVFACRSDRKDGLLKRLTSAFFYKVFSYLSGIQHDSSVGNFGIYHSKVITSIKNMKESTRVFSQMARWVGFKTSYIKTQHDNRFKGKSTYSWGKLISLATDIILTYSEKPLKIMFLTGSLISASSIIASMLIIANHLIVKTELNLLIFILTSIWFLSGSILIGLGLIGLYLSKVFEGVKNRPLYIVYQTQNL